jgi:anti-sigma regulatory factor (Ser/Thr protein kinase)
MPLSDLKDSFPVERSTDGARAAVTRITGLAAAWHLPLDAEVLTDLELVASEVVHNALSHSSGPIGATVQWMRYQRLRVEVTDQAPALPEFQPAGSRRPGSHGLDVVDALASRWAWEPVTGGKSVWFEIGLHRLTPERARLVALVRVARARVSTDGEDPTPAIRKHRDPNALASRELALADAVTA